jgi:hypothetical protein
MWACHGPGDEHPGDAQISGESLLSSQFRRAVDPSHALADGTSLSH